MSLSFNSLFTNISFITNAFVEISTLIATFELSLKLNIWGYFIHAVISQYGGSKNRHTHQHK